MINFPNSPTVGQQFTAAGVTWTWDGAKWAANGLQQPYLPLAGGTMSGELTLAGDPANALDAATKQYVDGVRYGDNRIINGDMRIDQRNNGASGTAAGYTVDRWQYGASQTSKGTWQRNVGGTGVIGSLGFPYYLQFISSSAYTALATDFFYLTQPIEADMVSDLAWGFSNAQPVTLSFVAFSTLAGTFSGSIRNDVPDRSYPFTFNLPSANTWTKIVITIPGDTGGNWIHGGSAKLMSVNFDYGTGANLRGPAGAWAAGNYVGATGAASVIATNGAALYLTGVKLEVGSIATPFNRQSMAKSLADCQRYYQTLVQCMMASYTPGAGGSGASNSFIYPVLMRATPTVGLGTPTYQNASALATNYIAADTLRLQCSVTAAGFYYAVAFPLTLSAEL